MREPFTCRRAGYLAEPPDLNHAHVHAPVCEPDQRRLQAVGTQVTWSPYTPFDTTWRVHKILTTSPTIAGRPAGEAHELGDIVGLTDPGWGAREQQRRHRAVGRVSRRIAPDSLGLTW